MKNFIFQIAIIAISALFFACSDNAEDLHKDEAPEQPQAKSRCLTPEEAEQNVMAFLKALGNATEPESRNILNSHRIVSDVKVVSKNSFRDMSRSSLLPDTLFYIVNFADSAGYAVAGAQPGMEPLYALVDKGNADAGTLGLGGGPVGDTIRDPNEFLYWKDAVSIWEGGGNPQYPKPDTIIGKWTIYSIYSPLLKTKWWQGLSGRNSYGNYFRNGMTGCTIIAAAQILCYYSVPNSINWKDDNGNDVLKEIHWPSIHINSEFNGGRLDTGRTPNQLDEVAKLCRTIGLDVKADDTKADRTTADVRDVVKWIRTMGGLNAPNISDYDEAKMIQAVKDKNPVYIRAENKAGRGHAWVIDGYISGRTNGENKTLFHCNWGFSDGEGNGYYVSKVFNANNQPELTDDDVKTRTESVDLNFYRDYKISVISKNN